MNYSDRLEKEANIWLATMRPDGRPHLVPIWHVWLDGEVFILTSCTSVKARNLIANPHASIALEDGNQPVIAECRARLIAPPYPDPLVRAFQRKYDWSISHDNEYDCMFALNPQKWLGWNS